MGIIIAILLFSFIVIFHEMGHFLIAKANGIEVEEFALGMGPLLFSKEYKGTRYCLRLLPIGGACMMGEDDEATGSEGNFHSKSVWARITVWEFREERMKKQDFSSRFSMVRMR